jgi:AraC-like DNA-binding protein
MIPLGWVVYVAKENEWSPSANDAMGRSNASFAAAASDGYRWNQRRIAPFQFAASLLRRRACTATLATNFASHNHKVRSIVRELSFPSGLQNSIALQPSPVGVSEPCYSARLLSPFLAVLRNSARVPEQLLARLEALDPEQRVHASYVHALLQLAEKVVGEPALGLKASQAMTTGDAGMFDFLLTSADTPRMAIDAGARYLRLITDAHSLSWRVDGERAVAQFESRIVSLRASEDFAIASLIRNHIFDWPEGMLEHTDAWFHHDAPSDLTPYQRALGPVRLHFGADFAGFDFPAKFLDVPLRKRDARLHSVLCVAAEGTLATLPFCESLSQRVRKLISSQLGVSAVSLVEAARQLNLHPRKLSRLLVREGTTFEDLVADVRRELALRHVAKTDYTINEVAALVGFSGKAPFHRAFRRWTGETPSSYRRKHRERRSVASLAAG